MDRASGRGTLDGDRVDKGKQELPPDDDVCPICFGDFTIPCKTVCGHWYCASCILQLWNYTTTSAPCKCPMCSRSIHRLTPQESLLHRHEEEIVKVLTDVHRYNLLFVGGARGFVQKVYQLPSYVKRYLLGILDPDRPHPSVSEIRLIAMLLSALYMATPFDFIPTGRLGIVRVFDYTAVLLFMVLRLVGFFQRRRLARRVRELGDTQLRYE
ncbi:RING-type domain-containing protein [Psidium guajava]|nr:RING-type domain-containing protein [Psidium guajava]